jgi:hypothetical protein
MKRLRTRVIQLIVLAGLALGASAVSADQGQAGCEAICEMQKAYCDAKGGTLIGDCYWDGNACNVSGCQLPIEN